MAKGLQSTLQGPEPEICEYCAQEAPRPVKPPALTGGKERAEVGAGSTALDLELQFVLSLAF